MSFNKSFAVILLILLILLLLLSNIFFISSAWEYSRQAKMKADLNSELIEYILMNVQTIKK